MKEEAERMSETGDREESCEILPSGHGTGFAQTNKAAVITGKIKPIKIHMQWG